MKRREIEARLRDLDRNEIMAQLDKMFEQVVGTRVGIALMLYPFGDGGELFWVCNSRRADMAAMFREMLTKWEAEGSVPRPREPRQLDN